MNLVQYPLVTWQWKIAFKCRFQWENHLYKYPEMVGCPLPCLITGGILSMNLWISESSWNEAQAYPARCPSVFLKTSDGTSSQRPRHRTLCALKASQGWKSYWSSATNSLTRKPSNDYNKDVVQMGISCHFTTTKIEDDLQMCIVLWILTQIRSMTGRCLVSAHDKLEVKLQHVDIKGFTRVRRECFNMFQCYWVENG